MFTMNLLQDFSNFFDVIVKYFETIWATIVDILTDIIDLISIAASFLFLPNLLSSIVFAPLGISLTVVIAVSFIKLVLGRDAQ